MSPKPIVGYYDIRGRAEPIRLLLTYLGEPFEDKRYNRGDGTTKSSDWFKVKFSFGFEFPNMPYYIDGEVKLTQTLAILRYLARKHGCLGATDYENRRIDLLEQQVLDYMAVYLTYIHLKSPTEEDKAEIRTALQSQLKLISQFLGSHPFVAGPRINYVDFWLYEWLHCIEASKVAQGAVGQFENLAGYLKRVEALPSLKEYLKKING